MSLVILSTYAVVTDPQDALRNYLKLIDGARNTVTISTEILTEGEITSAVFQVLLKKISQNVQVTVASAFLGSKRSAESPSIFQKLGELTIRSPADASILVGATLLDYDAPGSDMRGMLEKMLVIDRRICVFSDRSLDRNCYGEAARFTGMDIVIRDSKFAALVNDHICGSGGNSQEESASGVLSSGYIQLFTFCPALGDHVTAQLACAIREARQYVMIVMVVFDPKDEIGKAMREAAARGVKITILTNHWNNSSSKLRASLIRTLTAVKIEGWTGDVRLLGFSGCEILHNTFLMTDTRVCCSSYHGDFSRRLADNREYMIDFADPLFRRPMTEFAEHLLQTSQLISTTWLSRRASELVVKLFPSFL